MKLSREMGLAVYKMPFLVCSANSRLLYLQHCIYDCEHLHKSTDLGNYSTLAGHFIKTASDDTVINLFENVSYIVHHHISINAIKFDDQIGRRRHWSKSPTTDETFNLCLFDGQILIACSSFLSLYFLSERMKDNKNPIQNDLNNKKVTLI